MNQATNVQELPSTGFVRLPQIVGCRERGIPPLIPVCRSAWYEGIRAGIYPKGVLLGRGRRTRAWSVDSIRALIAETIAGGE